LNARELRREVESALGRGPVGDSRVERLLALSGIYRTEGVLVGGTALPLWDACPSAAPCWAPFPDTWRPGRDPDDEQTGGMILPWVGEHYAPGGVVILGINLKNASGLYIEYKIAREQRRELLAGRERIHNSVWAYRSLRSAAAVMRSMAGREDLDVADPRQLATVLDTIARVQAVKCSAKDGRRSARGPDRADRQTRHAYRLQALHRAD